MARRVFYSFHYESDNWRASQIRNIGAIDGNKPATDNDWETITSGGSKKIQQWIDNQLAGRTCAVVLIGKNTKGRKWIEYEIKKAWNDGKGVVGIHVHGIKDSNGNQSSKGANPFWGMTVAGDNLYGIVPVYDPPFKTSPYVYGHIADNIEDWIEDAIQTRNAYL